jgi:hypothetical protein
MPPLATGTGTSMDVLAVVAPGAALSPTKTSTPGWSVKAPPATSQARTTYVTTHCWTDSTSGEPINAEQHGHKTTGTHGALLGHAFGFLQVGEHFTGYKQLAASGRGLKGRNLFRGREEAAACSKQSLSERSRAVPRSTQTGAAADLSKTVEPGQLPLGMVRRSQ